MFFLAMPKPCLPERRRGIQATEGVVNEVIQTSLRGSRTGSEGKRVRKWFEGKTVRGGPPTRIGLERVFVSSIWSSNV